MFCRKEFPMNKLLIAAAAALMGGLLYSGCAAPPPIAGLEQDYPYYDEFAVYDAELAEYYAGGYYDPVLAEDDWFYDYYDYYDYDDYFVGDYYLTEPWEDDWFYDRVNYEEGFGDYAGFAWYDPSLY
jgi:hypothetical protein